ncbi:MAG: flagellar biosynthesis protein FlgN [Treponema sp.]|nr:flagellar biosynthesis protein FlgN [Candidatus Treponema equifaecale]
MAKEISKEELDERVAILKRFRKLLEQQRNKFAEYLVVLEKQQGKIEVEDGDAMMAHAELESQIVANIASLQKVIVPMQGMYNEVMPGLSIAENSSIAQLQSDLDDLQKQVLIQNEKNRTMLRAHIDQIKTQLHAVQMANPYRGRNSVYAERAAVGSMVSIEG